MLFGLGPMELSFISIALLMLFGNRLPKLAGGLARTVLNFKNALREVNISSYIKDALDETQRT